MSSAVLLSPATLALWAKSDRGKDAGRWHPLVCHLLDVAASCLEILDLEPESSVNLLAADFGAPPEQAVAITAALVGLHDLGKANHGFQKKNAACAARVEAAGFSLRGPDEIPHGIVTEAILAPLLEELGVARRAALLIVDSVGAHHGFRSERSLRNAAFAQQHERTGLWLQSQAELFHLVWDALGAPAQWPLENLSAAAFQRLMGLTCVADWIGSSLDFADYSGDPHEYLRGARQRAKERLRQVGWNKRYALTEKTKFEDLFPFSPRPLQRAMADLVSDVKEPVLLLVEAPMGEGKTEAAFHAHAMLQQQLGHRGAYVGLPSQATGSAMFERLWGFLKEQGREQAPDLQLLHGASILSESYQELQDYSANTADDAEQAVTAKSYFTHLKRALLSEYGAGTIDQALLSILPVKHHFVRLWGLANRTVILDEVHAYDTYTGQLLVELVAWLKALGSSVVLMSATLPATTRRQMLEAFGAADDGAPAAYPRITRVHAGATESRTFQTRPLAQFEVEGAPIRVGEMAAEVLEQVKDGGCMACIVNTVERAQQLYRALQERDPGLHLKLFHARFPIWQKLAIEEEVLRLYGKGKSDDINPHRPTRSVLVATQVVEQSLDLDFDVMLTDLAPIDLMLQRAGRLHRHEKNNGHRGAHEQAKLLVSGLDSQDITNEWRPTFWYKIYAPHILVRSWLALQSRAVDLNTDLDPLVQRVYDDSCILPDQDHYQSFLEEAKALSEAEGLVDSRDARLVNIGNPTSTDWKSPRTEHLPDSEDKIDLVTRKTNLTVTVVPLHRGGDGYYLDEALTERAPTGLANLPDDAITLYERTVKISRASVARDLNHEERHWPDSPLLRNCVPLVLTEGQCTVGSTLITLSPELGLTYEDLEK